MVSARRIASPSAMALAPADIDSHASTVGGPQGEGSKARPGGIAKDTRGGYCPDRAARWVKTPLHRVYYLYIEARGFAHQER